MTQEIIITDTDTDGNALSTDRSNVQHAVFTWLGNLKSEHSKRAYEKAWKEFMLFSGITNPYDVTYEDVTAFRLHLINRTNERTGKILSQATINLRLSGLSSFYNHAIEQKYVSDDFVNPCDGVARESVTPYGKATKLKDDHQDGNQIVKFLSQIDRDTFQGKRDYAIMKLMLVTGVRVSAIANAYVKDILEIDSDYYLEYRNKGGETKRAKMTGAINEVAIYLSERGIKDLNSNAPLFVPTPRGIKTMQNTKNGREQLKPITARTINNLIRKYAKMAGLSGIHAHSLRHTAGYMMRNEPIAEQQNFFGHKDPRVTLVYITSMDKMSGDKLTDKIADKIDTAMNDAM
jgi:integrase/recombinase XerD